MARGWPAVGRKNGSTRDADLSMSGAASSIGPFLCRGWHSVAIAANPAMTLLMYYDASNYSEHCVSMNYAKKKNTRNIPFARIDVKNRFRKKIYNNCHGQSILREKIARGSECIVNGRYLEVARERKNTSRYKTFEIPRLNAVGITNRWGRKFPTENSRYRVNSRYRASRYRPLTVFLSPCVRCYRKDVSSC